MTHSAEKPIEDVLAEWFAERYGAENVEQQQFQRAPRWFCDIVVETEYATLFIEVESRASEVRHGVAQALGYCADDTRLGIPMVVTPKGHLDDPRVERLRQSTTCLIREFDEEERRFV